MEAIARSRKQTRRLLAAIGAVACAGATVAALAGAAPAADAATTAGAWWHLVSNSFPTQLQPGHTQHLIVSAVNRGYEEVSGANSPIVLVDKLPPGVEVTAIEGRSVPTFTPGATEAFPPQCSFSAHEATCTYSYAIKPYARLWMLLTVQVAAKPATTEASEVSVTGGEIPSAAVKSTLDLAGGEPRFGLERFELTPEEAGGGLEAQAGAHPFQLTTVVGFNKTERVPFYSADQTVPLEPQLAKEVNVKLPPGLIGNPTPFPQCTAAQFTHVGEQRSNSCPQDSAVGYANITIDEPKLFGVAIFSVPIFNLVPDKGEPAKFGFTVFSAPIYLDTSVRTGGDYGVTVHVGDISQLVTLIESEVVFWGVPGDNRHDESRGWSCGISEEALHGREPCKLQEELHPKPLLVMPTSCNGPLQTGAEVDSWKEPHDVLSYAPTLPTSGMNGCNRLNFEPEVSVAPDSRQASIATGLGVNIHVPQAESLTPKGLSQSNVKNTTVVLPEGLVLNPSAADGLQACSIDQIKLHSAAEPECPDASKVGTVTIKTPLLPEPLTGAAYLAAQGANPFGTLVALYVVAEDPTAGVLIKLAGEVRLSATGQITSTFEDTPELPFEDFELHFFGGARAPLATPAACGSYATSASMTPWSETAPVGLSSTFLITSGPNGASCASQLGFTPTLTGGLTDIQAAGFSPLTTTMSRNDGEQALQSVKLTFPPGVMASLTGVELCREAQANAGTCGEGSLIGHTIVSVGIGNDPFSVTGGRVYLTGPYDGAPFGLSIVEPAVAGPFNLGTVVVRAKIEVNPLTAQITATTDPSGSHAIPTILDGIPLQIRHVNVTIDRDGFTFDPTNCEKMSIEGTLASAQGVTRALSVPFAVADCSGLPFHPRFKAATHARHTRRTGAYLNVTMGSSSGQANLHEVHVELPKALPSRLSTLQKACTEAVFAANPASCPAESIVGHAVVHTPILPVALTGPAYFVSHGGAKFPELIMVLQGYGVTVQLDGETFINNKGITSSTFKAVPDVPFSTFSLTLPTGSHSALAGNGNFCRKQLVMPTRIVGQNGKQLTRNIKLSKQGCKPEIYVLARKTKAGHASIVVHVPSAGKLIASGRGTKRTVAKATKAGRVRLNVRLRRKAQAMLAKHAHRQLKVRLSLQFKPKHKRAHSLKARVSLLLG